MICTSLLISDEETNTVGRVNERRGEWEIYGSSIFCHSNAWCCHSLQRGGEAKIQLT